MSGNLKYEKRATGSFLKGGVGLIIVKNTLIMFAEINLTFRLG